MKPGVRPTKTLNNIDEGKKTRTKCLIWNMEW